MKPQHLSSTKGQYLNCKFLLLLLLTPLIAIAQAPTGIMWDSAVGCGITEAEYIFDVDNEEIFIKACQGSTVTYTLLGDPSPWLNVDWIVTGGIALNPTNQDITIQWGQHSYGEIIIRIEMDGSFFTQTIHVELIPAPLVDFTIFPNGPKPERLIVCKDEVVYFQNLSQAVGSSSLVFYNWFFSDDNTNSAAFEPTHVFGTSGTFTVELTVTNSCNCSTTTAIEVEVLEEGLVIECNSIACENEVATYSVTDLEGHAVACKRYEWIVVGGTILSQNQNEVQIRWDNIDTDGFGFVTFDPNSCDVRCYMPTTIKVPVIKSGVEIKGPGKLCEGEQMRYSIPQWPSTDVKWKVTPSTGLSLLPSDQPNEVVLTGISGGQTYILEALYNNTIKGCGVVAFKEISVKATEQIIGPTTICTSVNGTYTTTSGGLYDWLVEGPTSNVFHYGSTITHNFTESGLHTVYIGQIDCEKPKPFTVFVRPKPEPPTEINGPLEICAGNPAFYSVPPPPSNGQVYWSITPGSGLIAETLGDTAVGDQITVFWNLGFTGLFQLRALYELDGCKGEAVVIYPVPKVINYGFTGEQMVCSSSYETYSVDFSDGDKYEWSILTPDLGSISEYPQDHEVEVLWNNVTAPTVALIELSMEKCGTRHIQQFPVTIMPSPTISINAPLIACRGEIINFSLNGLNSSTNITWDFGDGGVGSGPNPNYAYNGQNTNGTNYTVRVTASDPNDCLNPSTATLDIQIQPAPVAHLTPAINHYFCDVAAIAANPPTLYLTVDNNYAAATKIEWFQVGNPLPLSLPPMTTFYSPSDFGQYYALVESAQGCSDTTNVVSINQSDCNGNGNDPCIIVELSPTITSVNLTACNTGTATAVTNGSLAPISTLWMLDDILLPGQTTGTANFTVSGVGIHRISYHETYNNGIQSGGGTCDYSVGDVMEFIVPYETQLEYSITCSSSGNGYDVTLYDASDYFPTTPIQGLEYYVDSVNIPQASGLGQYTITNLAPGNYSLMLEIVGSGYSPCTTTHTIDLPALPTAIINAPIEACAGEPVQFSASVNDPTLTYLWDFGDNAKNSLPDPIRNFAGGNYVVSLTVTNGLGCSTTVSHTIIINAPDMKGELELNPATACYGDVINIEYTPSSGTIIDYVWSHEVNGTIVSTQTTNVNNIDVTQPGIYILDGVDANGCIQYGIDRIAVSFLEKPTAGISGPQGVCADEPFQLQARPVFENQYQYNWLLDGQPLPQWDDEPVITEAIATPGNYTYEVTVTAPSGCTDTASFDLEVFAIPEPPSVSIAVEDCDPY